MSRSKKAPIWTEGYGGNWRRVAKRLSNKKVRRAAKLKSGMAYRRVYDSWLVCDWKFYDGKSQKARRK